MAFGALVDGRRHRGRQRIARRPGQALDTDRPARHLRRRQRIRSWPMRAAALLEAQAASILIAATFDEAEIGGDDRAEQFLPGHDAADEIADEHATDARRSDI